MSYINHQEIFCNDLSNQLTIALMLWDKRFCKKYDAFTMSKREVQFNDLF